MQTVSFMEGLEFMNRSRRNAPTLMMFVGMLVFLLAACGDDDAEPASTEPAGAAAVTATASASPTPAPTEEPGGAVSSLEDVQQAVVRIVAEGTFRDPQFGEQLNVAGSGSGFIVDASGLVVTNNHVVTGAALLRVFVGGSDRPLNARLLGVSECSDLAVIDLDGDNHPFLSLYEGSVQTGLSAFAAGFPLGDPEFTLTRGIISKARADGESEWASVDYVLEHDARINPGNSGGPLVTDDGAVIGVNYASSSDTNQYFAIGLEELRRIIDRLSAGEDVNSIGVNGQAVAFGDDTGIWVASVRSGSPADVVGIEPGDIITRLEGLLLSTDGTMRDYCDILRTHGPDDVLSIEVLRSDSGQLLEGRLNSGATLEESFSFARELGSELATPAAAAPAYSGFREVTDDSGVLFVEVPIEWIDVDGTPWFDDEPFAPSITAARNVESFWANWTEPGVFFGVSEDLGALTDVPGLLDEVRSAFNLDESCEFVGRFDYSDVFYAGQYDHFENCGGEGVLYISLVALPDDGAFMISVQVQLLTQEDAEVLDQILGTFVVLN